MLLLAPAYAGSWGRRPRWSQRDEVVGRVQKPGFNFGNRVLCRQVCPIVLNVVRGRAGQLLCLGEGREDMVYK